MEKTIQEMLQAYNQDEDGSCISESDVERWAGSLLNYEFYNDIALYLAKEYHAKSLSYRFCDYVVNELWGIIVHSLTDEDNHIPDLFYEIYEAFDSGEFSHKSDKTDDPVAEHTDPLIAAIVAKFSS